jgi:hypothetical protein
MRVRKSGSGLALVAATLGIIGVATPSRAAVIFNFSDSPDANADAGVPVPNLTVGPATIGNSLGTVSAPVNTSSPSSGYTGATGTGNIGNAVKLGTIDPATSSYFSIVFTPDSGVAVSLSDLDFGTRSTSTGPQAYAIRTSIDNFATSLASGTIANDSTWAFKDNSFTAVTGLVSTPVEVRVYTFGGAGSPSNNTITSRLDDISIAVAATGTPTPEPGSAAVVMGLGLCAMGRRRRKV